MRSKTASARVGSDIAACHFSTGSWLTTIVERNCERSSITSRRTRDGRSQPDWGTDASKLHVAPPSCVEKTSWPQFPELSV